MKKCTNCANQKKIKEIPFVVAEAEAMRQQMIIQRLTLIIALLVLFLVGTNIAWIIKEVAL